MNDTSNTTNAASQSDIPQSVSDFMQHITDLCGGEHARWAENFNAGFANTLTTTVRRHDDGTTFLLTGDIPAMWLRDSSAQFRPYLAVAVDDPELTALITGLVRQQFRFINIDPYANAFNEKPSGATWDRTIRPIRSDHGCGNANTRWTPCATPFSWRGCCIAIQEPPAISMMRL